MVRFFIFILFYFTFYMFSVSCYAFLYAHAITVLPRSSDRLEENGRSGPGLAGSFLATHVNKDSRSICLIVGHMFRWSRQPGCRVSVVGLGDGPHRTQTPTQLVIHKSHACCNNILVVYPGVALPVSVQLSCFLDNPRLDTQYCFAV